MYRLLAAHAEVRDRRAQRPHPPERRPRTPGHEPEPVVELRYHEAEGADDVVVVPPLRLPDVFSRHVVSWMVAPRESAALAERLIATAGARQGIRAGQLTVHADRGAAMTSKPVALLLADIGVTKTHSRPQVSNDNPYSEAQFKTLKCRPDFPARVGSLEDARAHATAFFASDNTEHRHSWLGLHTPHDVHHALASAREAHRATVLTAANTAHPERFVRRRPTPPALPTVAWINPPLLLATTTTPQDVAH